MLSPFFAPKLGPFILLGIGRPGAGGIIPLKSELNIRVTFLPFAVLFGFMLLNSFQKYFIEVRLLLLQG